jgi:dTDP-D-glucose 4,6-dehydratase
MKTVIVTGGLGFIGSNLIKIKWPNGRKILSTKDLKLKNLKAFIEKHKNL